VLTPKAYRSTPESQWQWSKRIATTSALLWDVLTADDVEHPTIVARIQTAHERHGIKMHEYRDLNQLAIVLLTIFVPTLEIFGWRKLSDLEICATGLLLRRLANSMDVHFESLPKNKDCDGLTAYKLMLEEADGKQSNCVRRSETNSYLAKAWMDATSPLYFRGLFQAIWKSLVPQDWLSIMG